MDPTAAYDAMLRAYSEGDWEETAHIAGALLVWMEKQGFGPEGKAKVEVIAKCNEMCKLNLCTHVGKITLVTRDNTNGRQLRVYGQLDLKGSSFSILVGYHVKRFKLKGDRYTSKDTISYVTDIELMRKDDDE